jgi:hypothetical protein
MLLIPDRPTCNYVVCCLKQLNAKAAHRDHHHLKSWIWRRAITTTNVDVLDKVAVECCIAPFCFDQVQTRSDS